MIVNSEIMRCERTDGQCQIHKSILPARKSKNTLAWLQSTQRHDLRVYYHNHQKQKGILYFTTVGVSIYF